MQLLGNFGSRKPPDLPQTYAHYQYETAKGAGLRILQWRRPDLDLAAVTHRDKPLLEGPDVLAVGLEEFKGEILRCHARLSKPAPAPVTFEGGGHVFINADSTDKDLADALLKIFDDRKNYTAARPLFEGSAKDIVDDLEANLMNCEALVLLYGRAPPAWVRAQLLRYSKLERLRETPPRLKTILARAAGVEARSRLGRRFSKDRLSGRRSGATHPWRSRRIAALMSDPSSRLPYPGLRSFRREEGDLFFGREDCINGMVDRLAATRFLAVLGSSGTGKSSVVKTGLLDALDLGLMAAAGSTWRVVEFKPGGAPLKNLALRAAANQDGGDRGGKARHRRRCRPVSRFSAARPTVGGGVVRRWASAGGHQSAAAGRSIRGTVSLSGLCRPRGGRGLRRACCWKVRGRAKVPIYVALTMRSEYLGACALVDGLAEAISTGMLLIPRMMREQCRSAIVGPAAVCGFKIADELTNRLLNDLAAFAPWDDRSTRDQLDRLARRADQLPLLQYCLNRMWTRARDDAPDAPIVLTLADYERIGGLGGALNAHADEVLHGLGDDCRAVAEAVFRALTEGSSASDAVRRPTRFDELVAICGGDEARVRKVVDAFRAPGCNFLAPGLDPANPRPLAGDTIVDISHESLIRQWKQLSEWVETEGACAAGNGSA